MYEQADMAAQYIEFHYGQRYFNVPNFPLTCAQICLACMQDRPTNRALDLGCATGRASFELATVFNQVDAVDYSARLLETPLKLQTTGEEEYAIQDEGELFSLKKIQLCQFPAYPPVKNRITFVRGDACNLETHLTDYDLVFAGNLLDRLYDPQYFLSDIKHRIRPGGLLILTSPYTWLTDFTNRNKWLGGFKTKTGSLFTTLDGLKAQLQPEYLLTEKPRDIEFVIRETRRKFQHTVAQMSVWEKQLV